MMMNILITVWVLLILVLIRNQIAYTMSIRRLREIYNANIRAIDRGDYESCAHRHDEFDALTYTSMVLDLRRWTYRQFYPEVLQ